MTKHWTVLVTTLLATLLAFLTLAPVARADIFQWEYINPANPSQGKQQSLVLTPDGAGANAAPAADLSNRNLTKAYLIGANLPAIPILSGEYGDEVLGYNATYLNGANLSQADLTNANLTYAWLTNANLSGAEIRGARFSRTTYYGSGSGLTAAQLYSTASYQAHDLTGIKLEENDLAGVNLAGQNLTNANFLNAGLTGANLSQANLTNVVFSAATLTGAILTGAEVRGASFSEITAAQLYSTASYQAHDLSGIKIAGDQDGWNFASQNLTGAGLGALLTGANFNQANLTNARLNSATLTNANLSQANLTHANFSYAVLTGANFTGAEVRGAYFYRYTGTGITAAQLYSTASYQAHDLTGINLGGNNLAGANLVGQNLTNANLSSATLTGANLSQANLTNATLDAGLTGANLTGAEVRGASLWGITASQLYSTASYQAHDLSGVRFVNAYLKDMNFVGQNLTNANFDAAMLEGASLSQTTLTSSTFLGANLTGVNLTGADVRGAKFYRDGYNDIGITTVQLYSTASYQAHDLTGTGLGGNLAGTTFAGQNLTNARFATYTDLTGANLSQANLTNAGFSYTTLSGANLTGAEVRGANFARDDYNYPGSSGITVAQLYSTASYQANDLSRIGLGGNNLAGAYLSQTNLTNATFGGFSYPIYDELGGYLGDGISPGANLTNANLTGADARGANFQYATLSGANTSNLIQSDGHIAGLDLTAGASLLVRDYDGNPAASPPTGPLPIVVDQHLATDSTGTLRLVFDADPWDSTISFAPGIPVALGGTLELTFAPGVGVATQSGRTIDLFDWTGVSPTGAFTVESPYTWNLSKLYTTGEITLTTLSALAGDYSGNGTVGLEDYDVWKANFGSTTLLAADGNGDHVVDAADYTIWRNNLGATLPGGGTAYFAPGDSPGANYAAPEPSSFAILTAGAVVAVAGMMRRRARSGLGS